MSQTAQILTCSITEKPHTGLDECPRILLSCFRARSSELEQTWFRKDTENRDSKKPATRKVTCAAPPAPTLPEKRYLHTATMSWIWIVNFAKLFVGNSEYSRDFLCAWFFVPSQPAGFGWRRTLGVRPYLHALAIADFWPFTSAQTLLSPPLSRQHDGDGSSGRPLCVPSHVGPSPYQKR